jgi:hypothetical protein
VQQVKAAGKNNREKQPGEAAGKNNREKQPGEAAGKGFGLYFSPNSR